ncbi:lytic transglycosylase domain-containing protein [Xanthomonas hortorum]|uniref:lytic transglycosylase domain-containing protein n=1 Tax=Xanthomonas hortorum TaxID=56454 RepID=UPI003D2F9AF4
MATPTLGLALPGATFLLTVGMLCVPAHAQEIPPPAYQLAAQSAGIPSTVLYAVAIQESGIRRGGRIIPWPWSVNVAGESLRFSSRAEACFELQQALRKVPSTRVDAGLGQINLGYQKHRYSHPCELLDPYGNLAIAAQILREQHIPGDDWLLAIGRYHRPAGGAPAARYRQSVARHLDRVRGSSRTTFNVRKETSP